LHWHHPFMVEGTGADEAGRCWESRKQGFHDMPAP
jgi:hypothetical protein